MAGRSTIKHFFGASSSDDKSRDWTVSGSSAQSAASDSMDTNSPISRSSSMMSLGSEPEDSRPTSQASDQGHSQMDSVNCAILPGCSISSGDLQTINDKMATWTNFFTLSKVTKASTVPDTSSKVPGKTINIYNLKVNCKKCMSEVF